MEYNEEFMTDEFQNGIPMLNNVSPNGDINYSSNESSSNIPDEIVLENYLSKVHVQPSNNCPLIVTHYKSTFDHLGVIFERSNEGSLSSPTLAHDNSTQYDYSISSSLQEISTNHFLPSDDASSARSFEIQPINVKPNIIIDSHNNLSLTKSNSDSDLCDDSIMLNDDISSDAHTIYSGVDINSSFKIDNTQLSSAVSQMELIVSKRTPRFPIKNNGSTAKDGQSISLINTNDINHYVNKKMKTTEERQLISVLDESLLYYDKSNDVGDSKSSVCNTLKDEVICDPQTFQRSQEISSRLMTIDRVTHNINDVNDKMTIDVQSNSKKLPQTDKSSDFGILCRDTDLPNSNELSTEKDSDSNENQCVSVKPSPIHQVIPNIQPVNIVKKSSITLRSKVQSQVSHVSILPDSPSQIKHFQHPMQKTSALYKPIKDKESPTNLNVPVNGNKHCMRPLISKTCSNIDGSLHGSMNRHLSTSSSESSSNHEYQRTLSNSNNHNLSTNSPGNSDSGSFLSFNSSNQLEKKSPISGTSVKYVTKSKLEEHFGTVPRNRKRGDDEVSSLPSEHDPMKLFMSQSRSYNSLNALSSPLNDQKFQSGSLAGLVNKDKTKNIDGLCHLIKQHLYLNSYDRVKSIFKALIRDNDHERIETITDHFEGRDRSVLLELADKAGFVLNGTESMFDMSMSRTDLHSNLRPGISLSSVNSDDHVHSASTKKAIFWRPNIEEILPPPMRHLPKPIPTNLLKSAIISSEALQSVDTKILEYLQYEPTTFGELVHYLTRSCTTDVETVRALFRWITVYDMKHINFDPAAPNDSLIGVLRGVKCGQMSYNELFFRMCRFAGIHCQFIAGYSKGAGYRPGMTIKDNRMFRNVWTAVYVAGAWRLVNCNWGARYLTSPRREKLVVTGTVSSNSIHMPTPETKYRCDEFYFLTDPKQHIFEHFPDKKRWQLLNRPITLDQFMALPVVKSPFFNADLSFKRNYPETIHTRNGKVTVKINMPKSIGISCRLENKADNIVLGDLTLVRVLGNQMLMVTAAPSQPGSFYLSIYVNKDWRSKEEGREMACSFQVLCAEHNYDRLVTGRFPDVGVLGPTPMALKFGVVINESVDPFVIWDERSTMKLNLSTSPGLKICHKLISYDRSDQTSSMCDSYALLQCNGQSRHQYHIRFPSDSFYCLTIYAGMVSANQHSASDFEPMEAVYRLLVDCRQCQDRISPFPRQTSCWVGFNLLEPLCQHLELNRRYRFRIMSLYCVSMAVVINDTKWYELTLTADGLWKGRIDTGQELDNLSVYGQFREGNHTETTSNEEEFVKLLDYVLVDPNMSCDK